MQNILLLEDETLIALSIMQCIEANCTAQVHRSSSATGALKISRDIPIDLLIADINIKDEIDGIDVATQLGHLYNIPTLFLTSYGDELTLQKASQINSIGYILKPFREDELIAQLKLARYKYTDKDSQLTKLPGSYNYNYETKELLKDNLPVTLTSKEHQLFVVLLNASGNSVHFSYIDDLLWPEKTVSAGTRRQLFFRLCKKLPELEFENVSNVGYILNR